MRNRQTQRQTKPFFGKYKVVPEARKLFLANTDLCTCLDSIQFTNVPCSKARSRYLVNTRP